MLQWQILKGILLYIEATHWRTFIPIPVILAYPCRFPFIWGMVFALNQSNQMEIGLSTMHKKRLMFTEFWIPQMAIILAQ